MRIRRRPPLSFPPLTSSSTSTPQPQTLSQLPDPTHPQLHSVNEWCGRKDYPSGAQKLHPAQDPQLPQLELVQDANKLSDSKNFKTPAGSSHYMSNNTNSHVQVVKSEVKEEDEERIADSSRRSESGHELKVNSKKRISSDALVSAASEGGLGETALPSRRRRGSYSYAANETASKAIVKTRTKTNGVASVNESYSGCNVNESENCSSGQAVKDEAPKNVKKRRSPAVLMEGSRCSRVNGRGWRCCQQTLVGYSLCEHHLGKGRLRSMSSVKGQLGTSKPDATIAACSANPSSPPSSYVVALEDQMQHQRLGAENNGPLVELEEKEMIKKKRNKSMTAKAKSVTSLLNESSHLEATELPQREEVALLLRNKREQ